MAKSVLYCPCWSGCSLMYMLGGVTHHAIIHIYPALCMIMCFVIPVIIFFLTKAENETHVSETAIPPDISSVRPQPQSRI